jgi:hypothetical protein
MDEFPRKESIKLYLKPLLTKSIEASPFAAEL